MTAKLDQRAFDQARDLIMAGKYVINDRGAWSEHRLTCCREARVDARHGGLR